MTDTVVSLTEAAVKEPRQWLLLLHQLPPEPAYVRVKVHRRLQRLGAVALKNSVYVLPSSEEHLEDFQWLANEIIADGGDATICSATLLSGVTDDELESRFPALRAPIAPRTGHGSSARPRGAVWVTRQGVFVDRMASAWLIRRFIDPKATFRFVAGARARKGAGELRFDMYQGEYTHVGDRCTFETLLAEFGLGDRALHAIGEIVHDIDCKDDKFGRAEAGGIAALLSGIVRATAADEERIARGALVFDALYDSLSA